MTDRESEILAERLVSCLPAASFELETLCRLAGIRASRDVETAAVTCEGRSRLLVNPDFVTAHCRRDEHLFLLVMHELWHVILAHTRLWPRPTEHHNIAFDAVINAGLARQHRAPEYRGFFEALNPADAFPALLLRPPPGWPAAPRYQRAGLPKGADRIMRRLYPPPAEVGNREPLYEEILAVLERSGDAGAAADGPAPGGRPTGNGAGAGRPVLLGDHRDGCSDEDALDDPLLGDVVRRIVGKWPPPPFPLAGRDSGGAVRDWTATLAPPAEDVRRAFARVLRRCLGPNPGGVVRRSRVNVAVVGGTGVWPNAADRLAPARRLLGGPATLWAQPALTPARLPERPGCAHVYLDVSGSMTELLPRLVGLLVPFVAGGRAAAWQFSTVVAPLPLAALRRGDLTTTLGTGIDCVLDHLVAHPAVRRAVIVTDGYVGPARADLARRVADAGVRLHAVLPAESAWTGDLEALGAALTVLPPLRPVRRHDAEEATVIDEVHLAEDVLAGHPDRLADGIAERIVDEALAVDALALVGVEVAVHRRKVFVTGRVAAGGRAGLYERLEPVELAGWVREVYERAGYRKEDGFDWGLGVEVVTDLDDGPLELPEARIRCFSDDQNIVAGHAAGTAGTAYLPPGPYIARRFRQALDRARRRAPDRLGPDGKVLVHLEEQAGRLRWRACNAAIQHTPRVGAEELHDLVVPELAAEAAALEAALPGAGATFDPDLVRLNGIGDFTCGGPLGDNGLSGKKLVVDHYGPGVPIGGGALCGKDPHKVDRAGALAARQLAVRLVAGGHRRSATVWLGWFPGRETPDVMAARVDGDWWDAARLATALPIPDLSIEGIVTRLELASARWGDVAAAGYFGNGWAWDI